MGCCGGATGCKCVVHAATPAACNPITTTVTGSGATATPYMVGATVDLTKLVRLDGNEPWVVAADDDGCTKLLPRCVYSLTPTELMIDNTGAFVGYAFLGLDCVTGNATQRYKPLSGSVVTSLPLNWQTDCDDHSPAEFHPMCTDSGDTSIPDPIAGWFYLRYNAETAIYEEQYLSTGGSTVGAKPGSWVPCSCGSTGSGTGGGPLTLTKTLKYVVAAVAMNSSAVTDVTWTNMPLAIDFFNGSPRDTLKLDLTDWSEARLVVRKMGTAGAAASKIIAKYSTVNPGATYVSGDWLDLGASEISCAVNVQNQIVVSNWVALPSGAKSDVYVGLAGSGGDGVLDPIFGNVYIELRRQYLTDVTATGSGGGGGGGGGANSVELQLLSGNVVPNVKYPDGGIGDLIDANRFVPFILPPGFSTATWQRMNVNVTNVLATTTVDLKLTLKNLTTATNVGSVTIAAGTTPTGTKLSASTAISGTVADGDNLQWFLETVETGVNFLLYAATYYTLA